MFRLKSILCLFLLLGGVFFLSVPSVGSDNSSRDVNGMSLSQGKKAIEKFMAVTALWIVEMEWTFGHDNRTPSATDRAKAMLAGDVSTCPQDFQEAWLMQVQNPRRNYIAPVLRKYGIRLSEVRQDVERQLRSIDSTVRPPIPLYDEDEKIPRFDPRTCGSKESILSAVARLRVKLNGFDPEKYMVWQRAIRTVMLGFTLNYMEIVLCADAVGIDASEASEMFGKIDTKGCPDDFVKAWRHDVEYFKKGYFSGAELKVPAMCQRYGVNEGELLDFVKKKMAEWEIRPPSTFTQEKFRKEYKHLRANIMDYR